MSRDFKWVNYIGNVNNVGCQCKGAKGMNTRPGQEADIW
jgi:hypothetical protein